MSATPTSQADEPGRAPRGRRGRGYWVPGLIATAFLVCMAVALGAGDLFHRPPSRLYGPLVAARLAGGLQYRYGWSQPPKVSCPAEEPLRPGLRFFCNETHDGVTMMVAVVESAKADSMDYSLAGPAPARG